MIGRCVEDFEEAERRSRKQHRRSQIQSGAAQLGPQIMAGLATITAIAGGGAPPQAGGAPPHAAAPPQAAPSPPPPPPPAWLGDRLRELAAMGFANEAQNRAALLSVDGDLEAAIGLLVNM